MAFINMQDAQTLYELGNAVSGLRLKVTDLYAAPKVARQLQAGFQQRYLVTNWTQEYGDFFKAIKMEKTMMFFILILIVAVAAFNLVSSLVMIVTDKRPEIAILRTLGATPRTIMLIGARLHGRVGRYVVRFDRGRYIGLECDAVGGLYSATLSRTVYFFIGVFDRLFTVTLWSGQMCSIFVSLL